tara:strand:+ start:705 stop:2393 length:1689 start_codon:yes stop_codon:yes gene_type:complete
MTINKILALKYRPRDFKDLIGQEIVAQTITNAIKLEKTPNAYLLTGIRGIGKTTTARLIAKALNCVKNKEKNIDCNENKLCNHCTEIINSNHIDVLEMDAASKTGIDDIRELIENAKYSPTSAKYKIFIIDEVHMLSKQAFNGLLKTLEEPPPSLKFILATTEVRKIPVTILSRCQRFDLKRVSVSKLCNHLQNISKKENGKISEEAINLIAKASEGSVRDAVSLLDRAIISQSLTENNIIEANDLRKMLGLADKTKLILMFKEVLEGKEKDAITNLRELINNGIDPKNFLNDILEIIYLFSRRINLGPLEKDMTVSEAEAQLIETFYKNIDMQDIGLFWQLTIKTLEDLNIVGNENLTLEMFIMQLVHLRSINDDRVDVSNEKELIGLEKKIADREVKEDTNNKKINKDITNQLKNTEQLKTSPIKNINLKTTDKDSKKINITSFQDLIDQSFKDKEIELKYDLERNVKLVSFNKGKIDISFNEKLNKNFIKTLSEKLLLWTGERWIISLSKNSEAKSLYEKDLETKKEKLDEFAKTKIAQEIKKALPDALLTNIIEDKDD